MKETKWLFFTLALCFSSVIGAYSNLTTIYEWSQLEFDYPSESVRQQDINSGTFVPGAPVPIDVDVFYSANDQHENKIFVTLPNFQGTPMSLGTVTNKMRQGNPVIKPYPAWSWHKNLKKCHSNRIVSVYRIEVDECDRLWVLDTGRIDEIQVCPPQIMAFNLKTNELIHKYEIPSSQLQSDSILVTPVVDVRDPHLKCKDTFVYIADCQGFAIIVYDMRRGTSWKVQDKSMYPYPSYGTFRIAGVEFDLMDGILGMSISPYVPGQDRKLFYHAMSSPTESYVSTSYLRNQSLFADGSPTPQYFYTYPKERNTQVAAEAIDGSGIMYFGLLSDIQIACWNIQSDYGKENFDIIASNPVTLQFPSGLKVVKNKKGVEEMWTFTSRYQKTATGTLNSNEINFRILAANVDDLLRGSKCRGRKQHHHGSGGGYGLIRP